MNVARLVRRASLAAVGRHPRRGSLPGRELALRVPHSRRGVASPLVSRASVRFALDRGRFGRAIRLRIHGQTSSFSRRHRVAKWLRRPTKPIRVRATGSRAVLDRTVGRRWKKGSRGGTRGPFAFLWPPSHRSDERPRDRVQRGSHHRRLHLQRGVDDCLGRRARATGEGGEHEPRGRFCARRAAFQSRICSPRRGRSSGARVPRWNSRAANPRWNFIAKVPAWNFWVKVPKLARRHEFACYLLRFFSALRTATRFLLCCIRSNLL